MLALLSPQCKTKVAKGADDRPEVVKTTLALKDDKYLANANGRLHLKVVLKTASKRKGQGDAAANGGCGMENNRN